MGVAVAAEDSGDHDTAGRTLHAARQFDLGAEGGGAAVAAYVPRWGMQLTANWSESRAWAIYRMIQKKYAALIGDREPIVIRSRGIGLGAAMRYNIRIADDDRALSGKILQQAHRRRRGVRGAAE